MSYGARGFESHPLREVRYGNRQRRKAFLIPVFCFARGEDPLLQSRSYSLIETRRNEMAKTQYNADSITVLEGLEAVREFLVLSYQ